MAGSGRFWSASSGLDATVIEALGARRFERLNVAEPTADALASRLREELLVSRHHPRDVLAHFWDRDWRKKHKSHAASPEDHLWRAATAVSDIQDALDAPRT